MIEGERTREGGKHFKRTRRQEEHAFLNLLGSRKGGGLESTKCRLQGSVFSATENQTPNLTEVDP
jgi:hypothetical protein